MNQGHVRKSETVSKLEYSGSSGDDNVLGESDDETVGDDEVS